MSATRLPTFAPPNALRIWRDTRSIYVEIPGPGADCTIISYALSTGGLSKALALLQPPPDCSGPQLMPNASRVARRIGTVPQHNLAEALLRRKGIIK